MVRPLSRTVSVTDDDRSRVAQLLQTACGEGRIGLDEFSARVGTAWQAETAGELARATAGLVPSRERTGRSPRTWLRSLTAFGSRNVEIRNAEPDGVVEINGTCLFGDVNLTVPAGVAVEVRGMSLGGTQDIAVDAAPPTHGTPVVKVGVHLLFGTLRITQRDPDERAMPVIQAGA
ncbi:protein of unknown function [Pseudonocardia thermophila]|uniref:DUF1707 domain-containing protein n=1 Tax=Pseudonocardia thermophila TaxID=1848 RepID=A0A1M6ZMU8_PSETH|nr:protein of unknown function [Pseudonocardia thermophila]